MHVRVPQGPRSLLPVPSAARNERASGTMIEGVGVGEWIGVTFTGFSLHLVARAPTLNELAVWKDWARTWSSGWATGWAMSACGSPLVAPEVSLAFIKGRIPLDRRCQRCAAGKLALHLGMPRVDPKAVDAAVSELLLMVGALQN